MLAFHLETTGSVTTETDVGHKMWSGWGRIADSLCDELHVYSAAPDSWPACSRRYKFKFMSIEEEKFVYQEK